MFFRGKEGPSAFHLPQNAKMKSNISRELIENSVLLASRGKTSGANAMAEFTLETRKCENGTGHVFDGELVQIYPLLYLHV